MDIFAVLGFIVSVCIFIGVQAFVLRRVNRYESVLWQVKIACFLMPIFGLGSTICAIIRGQEFIRSFALGVCVSILTALAIGIYIFSIYSYLESSITVKLFTIVGNGGRTGVKLRDIKREHGVSQIIKRRIQRFLAMGVIQRSGVFFTKTNSVSSLQVREHVAKIIRVIFP